MLDAVNDAKAKLDVGKNYRRTERETVWEQSERQYGGDHWPGGKGDPYEDLISVNMSFSTINTITPYTLGSDPQFIISPYSGDASQRNAVIQQAFLNRLWRSRKLAGNRHLRTATEDALIYGDGWLKVGYDIKTKRVEEDDYAEVAQLWVARSDPWDVWLDPTADGIHNARWVCQRLRMTKAELEANSAFKNVDETNVNYMVTVDDLKRKHDRATVVEATFDGSQFADLYEFWDLVAMRSITFSEGPLPVRWIDDIGEVFMVQLANYRIPNSPYHMGELEQIWALQVELNKTRSQMATHRRRNAAKILAKRNALTPEAISALQSSVTNAVAEVDGDGPLDQIVHALQLPNLSADSYQMSEVIQRDIYEITGVNEYLRGATPEIRRTATEASIIEGASNIKTQHKLRMVENAARECGALLLAIARDVFPQTDFEEMQLFLTGREAEAITRADAGSNIAALMDSQDPEADIEGQVEEQMLRTQTPEDVMVTPSPDVWVGEYEVEVEQASTELRNPVMREQKYRQMFMDLINVVPILGQMQVNLNVKRLLELWFEAAQIDDVEALFEGMPMMPQMPQMGMMGGEAEMAPGMEGMPPPMGAEVADMGMLDASNTGAFPAA